MKTTVTKECFSYIRFSSEGQRNNSSIDRQSEIAPRVASQKGWILRNDWNVKQEAVSAFKKSNFPKLHAIIELAKDGTIPKGSVMIVESLDRVSRAEILGENEDGAFDLCRKLIMAGIELYDDKTSQHYTKESLKNPMVLMMMIMSNHAANEYSSKLSDRTAKGIKARGEKILNGEAVKGNGKEPGWITAKKLNHKAKTVAAIFKMYLDGIGAATIARKLNAEQVDTLNSRERMGQKRNWNQSVVYRLLSNRQVIGENTINGQTIKEYFEPAVSEETFSKAQARLADNRGKAAQGATDGDGEIRSIFSGVGYCAHCGRKWRVNKNGSGYKYISCWGYFNGVCEMKDSIRYDLMEDSFVSLLHFNSEQLVRDESGNSVNAQTQILKGRAAEVEKQIQVLKNDAAELSREGVSTVPIQKQIVECETQLEEIKKQIDLESHKTVAVQGSRERLEEITQRLKNIAEDQTIRSLAQQWIRENINRIDLDRTSMTYTVDAKNGKVVTMGLDGSVKDVKSFVSLFNPKTVETKVASVG
jgi:hypothetical protein